MVTTTQRRVRLNPGTQRFNRLAEKPAREEPKLPNQQLPLQPPARRREEKPSAAPLENAWEKVDERLQLKHPLLSEGDLTNYKLLTVYRRRVPGGWLVQVDGGATTFWGDPSHQWN